MVSVIIPVYNVKNYIEKCVKSVCAQTYSNLEIILVDDGSTDGCAEICDTLALSDPRIVVIHKENGGLSDARNAGMEIMKGDYIGFVDGDDWIEPTMYEKLLKACLEQDCLVSSCRYKEITDAQEAETFQNPGSEVSEQKDKEINDDARDFIRGSICLPVYDAVLSYIKESAMPAIYHSAWSKLYHKDIVGNMRFIKGRKSEDIPFAGEIFAKIDALAYVDEALYDYNKIREGSIMNVKSMEHTFEHEIPGWLEEFEWFRRSEQLSGLHDLALFYFYWRILSYAKDCHMRQKQSQSVGAKTESKNTENSESQEIQMYQKLVQYLFMNKQSVKATAKHPLANKKYAIRLRLFLFCPKLYWFLDSFR